MDSDVCWILILITINRWVSQENFRVEQWNAETLLKALPPLLQGSRPPEIRNIEKKSSLNAFFPFVSSRKDSGGSEGVARRGDEVAIVVSNRKDSLTNAVR